MTRSVISVSAPGPKIIKREDLAPLCIPMERTTWPRGSHIGHTGAGDRVLLIEVGINSTWCAAVVEITNLKGLVQ
jgi:hypothetical protein